MACPPLPVAWKTRTSQPARSSVSRARSTHAVVTPNIVAATSGLSSACASGRGYVTRPAIARAACESTSRLTRLMPRMSTTELSMKMSLSPTNCRTMPDASVLIITFGTPSGSARIAAVAMVVPADPPRPRMPDTSPRAYASRASLAAPAAAFVTASPRSALFRTASIVVSASSKIRSRGHIGRGRWRRRARRHRRGSRRRPTTSGGGERSRPRGPSCRAWRRGRRTASGA